MNKYNGFPDTMEERIIEEKVIAMCKAMEEIREEERS